MLNILATIKRKLDKIPTEVCNLTSICRTYRHRHRDGHLTLRSGRSVHLEGPNVSLLSFCTASFRTDYVRQKTVAPPTLAREFVAGIVLFDYLNDPLPLQMGQSIFFICSSNRCIFIRCMGCRCQAYSLLPYFPWSIVFISTERSLTKLHSIQQPLNCMVTYAIYIFCNLSTGVPIQVDNIFCLVSVCSMLLYNTTSDDADSMESFADEYQLISSGLLVGQRSIEQLGGYMTNGIPKAEFSR